MADKAGLLAWHCGGSCLKRTRDREIQVGTTKSLAGNRQDNKSLLSNVLDRLPDYVNVFYFHAI